MTSPAVAACRASLAENSKSFDLASRLLSRGYRDDAAVVYAWCRRADDAIDLCPVAEQPAALDRLRDELERVYAGAADASDQVLAAMTDVVRRRGIPADYPRALLDGMAMDTAGTVYRDMDDLLLYCYRVAGVVGLMMCHVMGISRQDAVVPAVHLGIAMQITNICRDVLEDWDRGRLYVPETVLAACGGAAVPEAVGGPFPAWAKTPVAGAVADLLAVADDYYASAEAGIDALPWRGALAVRTASRVYAAIGRRVRAARCDVTAGRAVVPTTDKLVLAAASIARTAAELPARVSRRARGHRAVPPSRVVEPGGALTLENGHAQSAHVS